MSYLLLVLAAFLAGFLLGRTWHLRSTRKQADPIPELLPPAPTDRDNLPARLHELESVFVPFGSNAAHPSELLSHAQFQEAVALLAAPAVPLDTVMQYVEGANWGLSCAALAALKQRSDRRDMIERVSRHCTNLAAWPLYFALDFLAAEPHVAIGEPLLGAKEWWADNPFMPLMFRDYFVKREAMGDTASFGPDAYLLAPLQREAIRLLLRRIDHRFATTLIEELSDLEPGAEAPGVLSSLGRFWPGATTGESQGPVIEPDAWKQPLTIAESALGQTPPRSLLIAGEPLVGKTSFLKLLADRVAQDGWRVFEAGGADLMAGQIYIGQLEGRIRTVVEELDASRKLIWYVPDIVQLARSGTHQGQSASILDQILPAVSAGRVVIWCEATPASAARLVQIQPSLRSLLDIIGLAPLSARETLSLAADLIKALAGSMAFRFHPDCAALALDTARQFLGGGELPGSVLLLLKLTATRTSDPKTEIAPRQVLETLAQLSGLPVSILDTKERLDLAAIGDFFRAGVVGQEAAVATMVERIAMLKAGLNDPGRPIGVFLFAGPTGTGKTELAKAVATFLFGAAERLIRLDMSEFQTPESIGKILGQATAPADAESLIARVRKQPFSVLLLDEFEKSHPMIWDLFLQVFDEGRLSDAVGQVTNFRHCLIILTSNLGATAHQTLGLGFAPPADVFSAEQVMRAISETYRPEFQNRLDKVIVFHPLTREVMRGILKKELAALLARRGLKDRAWAVEWESSAIEFLLAKGFSAEMGARPLKRAIDQHVVAPLAAIIVEGRFPEGEQFVFMRSDGQAIQVDFVDPDADASGRPESSDAVSAPAPPLAAMILTPAGTAAEAQALDGEYAAIEQALSAAEWEELKARLTADMSAAGFWERHDRFRTLARFALMDRVRAAMETAQALRSRMAGGAPSPRRYAPQLVSRLALQLHLLNEGIKDAIEDAPVEVALAIEPLFAVTSEKQAASEWRDRLSAMYRAWAEKRRMHLGDQGDDGGNRQFLVVSGFGAHRALSREEGLHVLDAPGDSGTRVTARVRLVSVALSDPPVGKQRNAILAALDQAPPSTTIVRRYRDEPPLARSGDGKWRSGRLDLVLQGNFDLCQTL